MEMGARGLGSIPRSASGACVISGISLNTQVLTSLLTGLIINNTILGDFWEDLRIIITHTHVLINDKL